MWPANTFSPALASHHCYTLSYEITLPSSPKHHLERPGTFQIEYNPNSDIQMPRVLPNLYESFTNCSYNSLTPPSIRQLPIATAATITTTTTWSNTTIGIIFTTL
jgi:hypothetical protein